MFNFPWILADGQVAYAGKVMDNLYALAGVINNVTVDGLAPGDIESVLNVIERQITTLENTKVTKSRPGNADEIVFEDGDTIQEKLDSGELNGVDGVSVVLDGIYAFEVDEDNGHLYVLVADDAELPPLHIDANGHLIYEID